MRKVRFSQPKKAAPAPVNPEPHICEECGGMASFGFGVFMRRGQPGRWFCGKHKHLGEQPQLIAAE